MTATSDAIHHLPKGKRAAAFMEFGIGSISDGKLRGAVIAFLNEAPASFFTARDPVCSRHRTVSGLLRGITERCVLTNTLGHDFPGIQGHDGRPDRLALDVAVAAICVADVCHGSDARKPCGSFLWRTEWAADSWRSFSDARFEDSITYRAISCRIEDAIRHSNARTVRSDGHIRPEMHLVRMVTQWSFSIAPATVFRTRGHAIMPK